MKRNLPKIALLLLLLSVFSVQTILSMRLKSATADEYSYLEAGRRLSHAREWNDLDTVKHPPLTYYAHGFILKPLTFTDLEEHLFYARLCMLPFALLMGVVLFKWAGQIFGPYAAFFALFLFCLSPNLIAHARWITTDVPFASLSFTATYFLWNAFRKKNKANVIACGVFLGLALLTKFTALMFLLIYMLIGLGILLVRHEAPVDSHTPRPWTLPQVAKQLVVVFAMAALIVNIGYAFTGSFDSLSDYTFWTRFPGKLSRIPVLKSIPLLLPHPFVQGVDLQLNIAEKGHPAYLWGMHSIDGWWYFYLAAFLVKVPVPMILLIALAGSLYARHKADRMTNVFLFLPMAFGFIYMSLFSRLQLGVRYVLFIMPYLYVWVSFLAEACRKQKRLKYVLMVLLLWYAGGTLWMYPDYLSYFNRWIMPERLMPLKWQWAGGPINGYKYLGDSDYAWGQNSGYVQAYIKNAGDALKHAPGPAATTGDIGVDVARLQNYLGIEDEYAWLRRFEPSAAPASAAEGWIRRIKPTKRKAYDYPIFRLTEADFERDVERHPEDAQAHSSMGWIHWENGKVEPAIESQMKALSCEDDFAPAYCALGVFYLDLGDYEKARTHLEKAIEIGGGRYILPYNLLPLVALYENNESDYERLHRNYVVAKNLNANETKIENLTASAVPLDLDAVSLNNIGAAWWVKGKNEKAREFFRRALARDPRLEEAHHNLGMMYMESGEFRKGSECAIQAGRTFGPRGASVRIGAGYFRVTGDAFKIMTIGATIPNDSEQIAKSDEAFARSVQYLLREYREGGDISLVIKHAYSFARTRPRPSSYLFLAEGLKANKLFRKARGVLIEGLRRNPDSSRIKTELRKLGRYRDGEK